MNYWEAAARLALAEDVIREARMQLGEGLLEKMLDCIAYSRVHLDVVARAVNEEGIAHVSIAPRP